MKSSVLTSPLTAAGLLCGLLLFLPSSARAQHPQAPPVMLAAGNGATNVPDPAFFEWEVAPDTTPGIDAPSTFSLGEVTSSSCPEPPSLISPQPDQSVSSPVQFEWVSVPDAEFYHLIVRGDTGSVFEGDFGETTVVIELPGGSFEWLVNAVREGCPPANSTPRAIQIENDCSSRQGARLIHPPSGASSPPFVFFEWSAVPGAEEYELVYSLDGGPFESRGSSREPNIGLALPPGLVRWQVKTHFRGCPPITSLEAFELTVEGEPTNCSDAIATSISPTSEATVPSPVTFQWSAVPGAAAYVVWTSFEGQPFAPIGETSGATSLTVSLPSGPIEWFVETHLSNCPPAQSPPSVFFVEGGTMCEGIEGPQLLTPTDGQADVESPVGFSWTPIDGAFAYRVVASINSEPPGEVGFTAETSLSRPLPPGEIEWWVEAIVESCGAAISQHSTFSTTGGGNCPTTPPSLMSPPPDSTSSSVVKFQWSESSPDVVYRIWLTNDLTPDEVHVIAETFNSTFELFLEPGRYTWWVEASRPDCPPAISATSTFTVTETTDCGVARSVNITPAQAAMNVASPVSFRWASVGGAVGYEVWVREADGAEFPVGFTDESSIDIHLPPGQWSWFVLTLTEGCEPVRSSETSFKIGSTEGCNLPPPFLAHPPTGDDVVMSPRLVFEWTPSPAASSYELYVSVDRSTPALLTSTSNTSYETQLPKGEILWHVVAKAAGCSPSRSADGRFRVLGTQSSCNPPNRPRAGAVPTATSAVEYIVSWEATPFATSYEIQESTSETFANPVTKSRTKLSASYTHSVTTATAYYYRVRAIPECDTQPSLFSEVVRVVVEPPTKTLDVQLDAVGRIGNTGQLAQSVFVPGGTTTQSFTASTTQTWMTVSPTSGTLPPEGTNLTVTVDLAKLPPGASTGQIVLSSGSSGRSTFDGSSSVPVTVSLVAPVTTTTKSSVKPESLIVPAVGHAAGFNSQWQSDIRITNITPQSRNYQLFFTPSGKSGTGTVKKAAVTIGPGKTIAFNDILKSWYGVGAAGESATGSLEIRPETQATSSVSLATSTIASSRTYNVSSSGTFGQFIPGVAFAKFVGKGTALSLQQLAQSNEYRTNIGVVEGSGSAATIRFTAYDSSGTQLAQWTENLLAGEHRQYDRVLAQQNITTDNARVEVEVTSDDGKITAYASKVDNLTGDPELITPVVVANVSDTKTVLAGVGDFDNGLASWRTDLRLYNGSSSEFTATLNYYPEGDPGNPTSRQVTVSAGEVLEMDDLLRTHFGLTNRNGALHVTTASPQPLVATARTYNKTSSGTYGQFIPGIRSTKGVNAGGRTLQLLQIEQSPQYRANLGLFEMSGNAVTVEVTAIVPGALAAPSKRYSLQPNEFRQINPILPDLGINEAYNARLAIRVVSGNGRINAYASIVDMSTQDPTYVPAQ